MGRKLNPENPMFRGGAPDRRAEQAMGMAPSTGSSKTAPAAGTFSGAAATKVLESSDSVDFQLDSGIDAAASDTSVEFGLDTEDMKPSALSQEKPAAGLAGGAKELDEFTLDTPTDNVIDFEAGKGNGAESVSFEADTAPGGGAADEIKWDLETQEPAAEGAEKAASGNGADDHWDETATKLDLAKAYIDMGDAEGARSILDEVLAEGNDAQKKQAAELAAQIA
jgi:pilus assembly protein FimV